MVSSMQRCQNYVCMMPSTGRGASTAGLGLQHVSMCCGPLDAGVPGVCVHEASSCCGALDAGAPGGIASSCVRVEGLWCPSMQGHQPLDEGARCQSHPSGMTPTRALQARSILTGEASSPHHGLPVGGCKPLWPGLPSRCLWRRQHRG